MAPTTIQDLAPEIVANIVSQAAGDIQDLKNIRLASKNLNSHAVRELFRETFVRPTEDAIAHWNAVAGSAPLAQLARRAVIHTVPDITDDDCYAEQNIEEEVEEGYQEAVSSLAKFQNLDSLLLAFSAPCLGLGSDDDCLEVMETVETRVERLQLIFNAIKARQDAGNSKIQKLTLMNLQNQPIPEFTGSDVFRDVMGQLDELHVQMVQEYNEHGPDHDFTRVELQTFPRHLCSAWLFPIAANLKELSLYSRTENWGPFPGYFDPSAISFPKLETLSLGYYTIAYDDQLDWVLSIKSLKKLVMHRCMIARRIRIAKENMQVWKTSTRDWEVLEADPEDWCDAWSYHGRWSSLFEALATGLLNLQAFAFDYPCHHFKFGAEQEESREYGVEIRHSMPSSIFPARYVVFDNGILPTHWPEASDQGVIYWHDEIPNFHNDHLEEDRQALDSLLEVCRSRK
ncbi:hypothetical protein PG993_010227 [Apiospora rasikravindrae]|uniref:F-box domain-containing protein n=1 Tax=Apiospora rasikravindrae TaxID=990691 RepID=A0ABR1SLP8_9PEZI